MSGSLQQTPRTGSLPVMLSLRGNLSNLKESATWNRLEEGRGDEHQPAWDSSNWWALYGQCPVTVRQEGTLPRDYFGNQRQGFGSPVMDRGPREQREKSGIHTSKEHRKEQLEGRMESWDGCVRTNSIHGSRKEPPTFAFKHFRCFCPSEASIVHFRPPPNSALFI